MYRIEARKKRKKIPEVYDFNDFYSAAISLASRDWKDYKVVILLKQGLFPNQDKYFLHQIIK